MVSCFVCVRGELIALPRSIVFGKVIYLFVMSVLEGLIALPRSKYMERYFGCSFFTTFFLREKESGGKKSAYKGDCAAIRYATIRRSLPLIYPPDDCSADSDLASYRPKRSASIMPRVSYFENARIKLGFFPYGKYAHPMPQKISQSNIQMRLLFAHPHLQEMVRIPRL